MHTTTAPNIAPEFIGTRRLAAQIARALVERHGVASALARAEARLTLYVQECDGVRFVTDETRWIFWTRVVVLVRKTPQPSALAQAIALLEAEDRQPGLLHTLRQHLEVA
jgi:hypothetical protein